MFIISPPALVFSFEQDQAPLNRLALELAAKAELLMDGVEEKPLRALLLVRSAAARKTLGDATGATITLAKAKELLAAAGKEATLDNRALAIAFYQAGDSQSAKTHFDNLRQSARAGSDEGLTINALRELAETYHEAGDDKSARTLLREIAADVKRVEGAGSAGFSLLLYSLSDYDDPDTAETLTSQHKEVAARAVSLRKIALARKKTDLPRAKATLQRALQLTLADKNKNPGTLNGHVSALCELGMQAEAKAVVEKLPTLFPQKAQRTELARFLPTCYALLGMFPKAITLAEAFTGKERNGKLFDLVDEAVKQKNNAVMEQLFAKILKYVNADPEMKGNPNALPSMNYLSGMVRTMLFIDQARYNDATNSLRDLAALAASLPITDAKDKATGALGLAEVVAERYRVNNKKG